MQAGRGNRQAGGGDRQAGEGDRQAGGGDRQAGGDDRPDESTWLLVQRRDSVPCSVQYSPPENVI